MKKNILSTAAKVSALVSVIALTGCAEWDKRVLDNTNENCDCSTNFTRALSAEYRMLGETEQMVMFDDLDADLWYDKAYQAKMGAAVLPEYLNGWKLRNDLVPELWDARDRLLSDIQLGAREVAPEMTAHAQVHFDCWVEQTEEGWQKDDIRACRDEFYKAIGEVELMLNHKHEPSVQFTLDSADLDKNAQHVIDHIMAEANSRHHGEVLYLRGETDKVGSKGHNHGLAAARVQAVKNELISRGFPAKMIRSKVVGEMNRSKHVDPKFRRVEFKFGK